MNLALMIVLVLLFLGGLGGYFGGWHNNFPGGAYGYGGSLAVILFILIVVVVLMATGRL